MLRTLVTLCSHKDTEDESRNKPLGWEGGHAPARVEWQRGQAALPNPEIFYFESFTASQCL
jgi:hypothetical protein